MQVVSELKPLYANLKRLNIGKYFYSNEFKYFTIEQDIDILWQKSKKEVSRKKAVIVLGRHNIEDDEEAFLYLMSEIYIADYNRYENVSF